MKHFFKITLSFFALLSFGCATTNSSTVKKDNGQKEAAVPRKMTSLIKDSDSEKDKSDIPDLKELSATTKKGGLNPLCNTDPVLPGNLDKDLPIEELHLKAIEYIYNQNTQGAISILAFIIQKAPEDSVLRSDYGTALLQCGMINEGIKEFEQAFELNPDDADIAANLGQAYQIGGRMHASEAAYRKAVELAPKDGDKYNNLAIVLLAIGELDNAEQTVRKAILLNPENTDFLINLGYILTRLNRLEDARIILERAVKKEPKNANAHNMLGFVYAAQKKDDLATDCFKKALEIDPDHAGAKENLKAMGQPFDMEGPWNNK
ncbi:MAG: tetratricopeptide repeat protein [Deltaproteobacteria bacterium]|nr:tetratricopeptide repeat protein [Deltaproteobacteria bacterium]